MGPEPDLNSSVPGMAIWGWMSPAELTWLGNTAVTMDSIVEIGSLRGRTSFALLTACPGPVYCIDPWNDEKMQAYPAFFEACGGFENLRAIRGYSPEAAEAVEGDIDMAFIDGDHDYLAVLADLEAWTPKTRKLICGHDYQSVGYPGVTMAVHEFFDAGQVKAAPLEGWPAGESSIWAVRLDA